MGKKIEVTSAIRGFLINLFEYPFCEIEFIVKKDNVYENTNHHGGILYRIFMSRFFDKMGLIFVKKVNTNYDSLISYNRILNSNKPYYIILENPTALYHYKLKRNKGLLAQYILKKYVNDKKVAGIICMCEACSSTFKEVTGITWIKNIYQTYPLLPDCMDIDIEKKDFDKTVKCLFISSQFELKGGQEIVKAAERLTDVQFTIVTCIDSLDDKTKKNIDRISNITLMDFKLNREEMNQLYRNHDILLNPTRQDSIPMVVLEAIKRGLPVISTRLYAIKEMVIEGYNGYLCSPRYPFFDEKNFPNPAVWNKRKETIYSKYIDEDVIEFLCNSITALNKDRDKLKEYSKNSLRLSQTKFGEATLSKKWEQIVSS